MNPKYDVPIIGGDSGASTAAALLALCGHRVVMPEREKISRLCALF